MDTIPLWLMTGNPHIKARWKRWLSAGGWQVIDVPGPERLSSLPLRRTGSALLDASLLKESDMAAVRDLSAAKIPVIIFGEGPSASNERVIQWLQEGADDFISASIQERLLVAKLQAYARRIMPETNRSFFFSKRRRIKLDVKRELAWIRDDQGRWRLTPSLTRTELDILRLFLSLPETLLERDFILTRLWGEKANEVYSATLTQHVMSLRKKLGAQGESIRAVYGRGYMLLEDE